MVEILNDLEEYCDGCHYCKLIVSEKLGSGRLGYSCVRKDICKRVYDFCNSSEKKRRNNNV